MDGLFGWILSFIPTWVWVVVVLAAVVLTASFWMPIWRALPRTVQIALLGIGATIGGVLWGRSRGWKDARDAQAKRDAQATANRLKTAEEIRRMSAPERQKERQRWERD